MTKEMGSNVVWFGLGAAFLLAALVRIFIFDLFLVEGSSMEPAFKDGSVILLNRAAYGLELPFSEGYLARWGKARGRRRPRLSRSLGRQSQSETMLPGRNGRTGVSSGRQRGSFSRFAIYRFRFR